MITPTDHGEVMYNPPKLGPTGTRSSAIRRIIIWRFSARCPLSMSQRETPPQGPTSSSLWFSKHLPCLKSRCRLACTTSALLHNEIQIYMRHHQQVNVCRVRADGPHIEHHIFNIGHRSEVGTWWRGENFDGYIKAMRCLNLHLSAFRALTSHGRSDLL